MKIFWKSTIFNSIAWGRDKYHLICYADSHHSGHLVAFSRHLLWDALRWLSEWATIFMQITISHIICETSVLCKQNQHPMWDQSRVKGREGGCRAGALSGEQTIHFADNCYTLNHSTIGTLLLILLELLLINTHTNTIQLLMPHTEPLRPGASNKRRDTY